jgi:predicted porin
MYSLGASYSVGKLNLAAAYFYAKSPGTLFADGDFGPNTTGRSIGATGPFSYVGQPRNERIGGVAGNYTVGKATIGLDYTNTRFADANGTTASVIFQNFDTWIDYALTPAITVGADYTFTLGKINYGGGQPKYHQFGVIGDYSLSKRTDVYVSTAYQRAAGSASSAVIFDGAVADPSTNQGQLAVRLAMVHKF